MDPTNKPLTITLEGVAMDLYFDFHTIVAFERESKRNYMNWIAGMAGRSQKIALELQLMGSPDRAQLQAKHDAGEPLTDEELSALADAQAKEEVDQLRFVEIAGDIMSFQDFVTIIWAAYHTPGQRPRWLSTVDSLSVVCDQTAFYTYAIPIMQVACKSVQRRKKLDDPATEERPTNPSPTQTQSGGGKTSGDSDEEILASLTTKLAN